MDLTRQPPRRPTNLGIAGIVGAARMTDKARAANAETLGDYIYGEASGLDQFVLSFLGISADTFAEAAAEHDDAALSNWVLETSRKTEAEIAAFNEARLTHLPDTDAHRRRLQERIARFAPGRTDVKTLLQSMELDDWGSFWQVALTERPPRSARAKDVGGICGVARMADKARAERAGKIGDYIYGEASGQDVRILTFLGIAAADFQEAAVNNPNDLELGEWVLETSGKSAAEIDAFNHTLVNYAPNEETRERFESRCREVGVSPREVTTWVALQDVDDEGSFGIVDLARHAPRRPSNTDICGIVHVARMVDKGRAANSDSLGLYYYGEDSSMDRITLEFLGLTPDAFADALKSLPTDADVDAWLRENYPKDEADIAAHNERLLQAGPTTEAQWAFVRKMLGHTDAKTWFEFAVLDDEKTFAI